MGAPATEFAAFPLKGCWRGSELRDLIFPLTERTTLSVIWYLLLIGIFLVIPLHHKKYFERAKFYEGYKNFWFAGSLAFAALWMILMELGEYAIVDFFPPRSLDFHPKYLIEPAIHFVVITFAVWHLAITPATKQYKNRGN